MLELYHHSESVCAQKARLALAEKGVEWNSRYIALEKGEQHKPEFRKINPRGLVPVLVHDGKIIPESTVICEYVDEAFDGPPLMPDDPYQRTRKRLWSKTVDEALHFPYTAAMGYIISFRNFMFNHLDTPEKIEAHLEQIKIPKLREIHEQAITRGLQSPLLKEAVSFYDEVLGNMESALKQENWLAGNTFSLADIALAPYIHRLADLQLSMMWENRPHIADWYRRLKARPSWQAAIVDWNDRKFLGMLQSHGAEAQQVVEKIWRNT